MTSKNKNMTKKQFMKHRSEEMFNNAIAKHNRNKDCIDYPYPDRCMDKMTYEELYCAVMKLKDISRANFLPGVSITWALQIISNLKEFWIRPLESWECKTKSRDRIISSLMRHLLAKYEVPLFMDSLFANKETVRGLNHVSLEHLIWVDIAQGKNIRKADSRVFWTKRMAYIFMQTPSKYTYPQAVRRAQLLSLGENNPRFFNILTTTFLRDIQEDEEFWHTIIHWFVNHPMIDPNQVGPLLDYIRMRKGENEDWSIKGRSPLRLIHDMEEWHTALQRLVKKGVGKAEMFESCGILPYKTAGKANVYGQKFECNYIINEILSAKELIKEGAELKHCVASYAYSIRNKRTSIFSLGQQVPAIGEDINKLITVEVDLKSRRVVQARGWCNRFMNEEERRIVKGWAAIWNLQIAV